MSKEHKKETKKSLLDAIDKAIGIAGRLKFKRAQQTLLLASGQVVMGEEAINRIYKELGLK